MSTARSTASRGYGTAHQRERARHEPAVEAGEAFCCETVCIMPTRWIRPGSPWHLAHTEDRTAWLGPSHAACNLAERNRRVAKAKPRRRRNSGTKSTPRTLAWRTSRQW